MKNSKSERPITVLVGQDLGDILRARAVSNHRSLTKEVVYLIETALGCSSENVRETIHLLYKAGVDVTPEATSPLA